MKSKINTDRQTKIAGLIALVFASISTAVASSPVTSTGVAYQGLASASGAVWVHRIILFAGLLFVSPIVYFLWKSMKAFSLESIMGGSIRYIYAGSLILSFLVVNRTLTAEFGYNILEITLGAVNAVILSDLLLVSAVFLYAYGFKIITTMYDEEREE
jgi:hypothetical protein